MSGITANEATLILQRALPPWAFGKKDAEEEPGVLYAVSKRMKDGISHEALVESGAIIGEQTQATEAEFHQLPGAPKGELLSYFLSLSKLESIAGQNIEDVRTVPPGAKNWRGNLEAPAISR